MFGLHSEMSLRHPSSAIAFSNQPKTTVDDKFQPQSVNSDRDRALDGLRAAARLLIVAYHALWMLTPFNTDQQYLTADKSPLLFPLLRGPHVVDVFFVLTGYVLMNGLLDKHADLSQPFSPQRWWLARLRRILPGFFAAALICSYAVCLFPRDSSIWLFQAVILGQLSGAPASLRSGYLSTVRLPSTPCQSHIPVSDELDSGTPYSTVLFDCPTSHSNIEHAASCSTPLP